LYRYMKLKLKLIQEAAAKAAPPPLVTGKSSRTGRNCTHPELPFYRPGYGA
jgi:hypothetical protein